MDFQPIIDFDKQLLLLLNGSDSLFLDSLVVTLTTAWTWVPLYISLLIVVIKNSESALKISLIIVFAYISPLVPIGFPFLSINLPSSTTGLSYVVFFSSPIKK